MTSNKKQVSDAATAVEQVADSRTALVGRLTPPWWYYLAIGVWAGGFIALGPLVNASLIGSIAFFLALVAGGLLFPRMYRKAAGFSVDRPPPGGRSRAWQIALILVGGGLFLAGVALQAVWGWVGPVLAGIVAVPLVIVVWSRYDAAVRADLRERA